MRADRKLATSPMRAAHPTIPCSSVLPSLARTAVGLRSALPIRHPPGQWIRLPGSATDQFPVLGPDRGPAAAPGRLRHDVRGDHAVLVALDLDQHALDEGLGEQVR